jgi:hypothetical protein
MVGRMSGANLAPVRDPGSEVVARLAIALVRSSTGHDAPPNYGIRVVQIPGIDVGFDPEGPSAGR